MQRKLSSIAIAILIVAMLTSCADGAPLLPTASPDSSPSATMPPVSESPSPTASPSATPSEEPTPTTSQSAAPPTDEPPRQVSGVTTQDGGGSGEVLVRWTQSAEADVVSYTVWRSLSAAGPFAQIGIVSRAQVEDFEVVPFVDSTATVAFYQVRAVDAAGQSGIPSVAVCGASVGNSC